MLVTLYKKTISRLLILIACLFLGQLVNAQQYPVQIVPQLLPPYTLNVSDYYNGTSEKLVLLLTNTDLNKPTLQVRLRMSIQGQAAKLISRDNVYYPSISLDGGVPTRISLADLAPYFNADNLIFEGITRAQYVQSGKLPEGFYQFCFEAVEVNSGQVVGRSSCAMAWISLSDPPLLNLPRTAESIVYKDPQNIIFQWTPRNYNSPTSAFNTEYEFSLVEIWDNGLAPEAAFGTAQPLYRTTTQATTLLYGPGEPLLLSGHKYAWRVRAQQTNGSSGSDAWRNNGYSEIFWFNCQNNCAAPLNVQHDLSGGRATITWSSDPNQTNFTVDYREKGQSGSTWYSSPTTANRMMLYDLKKDKTYEYRVGGTCDNGITYTYSDIKTLVMAGADSDANSSCGILVAEQNIANRTPIQTLLTGDVITAGDFPVKLLQVSGQGNFTGAGYVTVPFLGQSRVKVKFTGVTVNTDKQLIGGVIETTYDAKEAQIVDAGEIFNDVGSIINALVSKLQQNDKGGLQQIVDSLGSAIDNHFNNADNSGNVNGNADNSSVKQAVIDKMNELKDIVDKTPLNTNENKDSVVSKITAINQLMTNSVTATAPPSSRNKTYYEIEGYKFYHGDTIFLPQSNKVYTFKAHRDGTNLFGKGSIWSGISRNVDSATGNYVAAIVSPSISGSTISTIYSDSSRQDTLICKVVVVNVVFKENAGQNWGFDENNPLTENDYPSYKTTTPVPGIKWKSINTDGSSEMLNAEILPAGAERKVYFTLSDSINFSVTPRAPLAATQQLNITSNITKEIALIPKVGYFTNDTTQIKIAGMSMISQNARVVIVNESNDDVQVVPNGGATASDTTVVISSGQNKFLDSRRGIDILGDDQVIYRPWAGDSVVVAGLNKICESNAYNTDVLTTAISTAQLKDSLNKYYRQSVYEWDVDPVIIVKTINFDFDRDGKIDVKTWKNRETQAIYDSCIEDRRKVNFIAVNNPSDGTFGMSNPPASNPDKVCFLHPNTAPNVYMTAVHEIGHGIFNLKHPFAEFIGFPKGYKDVFNIMNYNPARNKFRKYQWDKIR